MNVHTHYMRVSMLYECMDAKTTNVVMRKACIAILVAWNYSSLTGRPPLAGCQKSLAEKRSDCRSSACEGRQRDFTVMTGDAV